MITAEDAVGLARCRVAIVEEVEKSAIVVPCVVAAARLRKLGGLIVVSAAGEGKYMLGFTVGLRVMTAAAAALVADKKRKNITTIVQIAMELVMLALHENAEPVMEQVE